MSKIQEQIEKLEKELDVCINELNVKLNSPAFAAERTTAMVNIANTILLLRDVYYDVQLISEPKQEEPKVDNRKKSK